MNTNYKTVVVIGYGIVTGHVLETVYETSKDYCYDTVYIEHEEHPFNQAKKFAEKNGIKYKRIPEKRDVFDYFIQILKNGKLLIISASNNYIFPSELVDRGDVDIINYHNALLPNYPGRNAPSWAIYNAENETGITWHYVSSGIDTGDIIIQKKTSIDSEIKAYELVAKLMDMASKSFDEIYKSVLLESVFKTKQVAVKNRIVYKSYEIPNKGFFDIEDDPDFIYKLLRATDYGKNDIFPPIKTIIKCQLVQIKRYKIVEDMSGAKEGVYYIPYNYKYIMLKYERLSTDIDNDFKDR